MAALQVQMEAIPIPLRLIGKPHLHSDIGRLISVLCLSAVLSRRLVGSKPLGDLWGRSPKGEAPSPKLRRSVDRSSDLRPPTSVICYLSS